MSHLETLQSAVHLVHTTSGDLVRLGALGDQALFDAGVPPELREGRWSSASAMTLTGYSWLGETGAGC